MKLANFPVFIIMSKKGGNMLTQCSFSNSILILFSYIFLLFSLLVYCNYLFLPTYQPTSLLIHLINSFLNPFIQISFAEKRREMRREWGEKEERKSANYKSLWLHESISSIMKFTDVYRLIFILTNIFYFLFYFLLLLLLFHMDKNNKSIFNMGFWKVWEKKQIIREIQEFKESSVSLF